MKRLLVLFLLITAPLSATTRYISPSGSDANSCAASATITTPKLTFTSAIACMAAGDTLIMRDGTYTNPTTGLLRFSGKNGTAALPITIKAENERQAFISGDGYEPILISNSSYVILDGIRVKSVDYLFASPPPVSGGHVVLINTCNHITLRRMLISNNNRYYNGSIVNLYNSSSNLLEENEIYYYHRNGLGQNSSTNNVYRRNYMNSRNYADIGGYTGSGGDTTRGDSGLINYPGSYGLFENNILENTGVGLDMECEYGPSTNNKFLGNISSGTATGLFMDVRGTTINEMAVDTIVENDVSIGATGYASYLRGSKRTLYRNSSILNYTGAYGVIADTPTASYGDGDPQVFLSGINAVSLNGGTGFYVQTTGTHPHVTWTIDHSNVYGAATAYSPNNSHVTTSGTVDPSMGSCKAWIPAGSPMKGAGLGGTDIGANVLYEYVNGVLTSTPLWNTSTNDFVGCGAIVAGVNDTAGNSCSNADIRLNIGTANGCAFPSGYGGTSTAGGLWLATDNFDSYTIGADLDTSAGGSGWTGNWAQGTAAMTIAAAPAGTNSQGGNAAFANADPNFSYSRAFADLSAGLVSFLFRLNTTDPGDSIFFTLDEGTAGNAARAIVSVDPLGYVKIYDGVTRTNIGSYTADTWNKVTIEFDDAAQPDKFRAKLNAGNFSQWYPVANGGTYSVINHFRVFPLTGTGFASQLYLDAIQEGNASSVQSTIAVVDAGLASQGFFVGTVKPLAWSSTDLTGNIDLAISRNGGLTYELIANGISNTGTYNWTVTGPACSSCRVKVSSSSNSNINDVSLPFRVFGRHLR